ncbi:MAG: aminotransferase class III-fold pyridoxal phosphate-dependent enzyme [Asgard group archaeon]|nr:aminotransferase class III-fold pyridoxal phosphate-dependent enzyme [Asgard group archaeon]
MTTVSKDVKLDSTEIPLKDVDEVKKDIIALYKKMTPTSKKHFEEAQKWLPGGGTRNIAYFYPYPFFIKKGEGFWLEDVDGNRYLDVQNNMTVLLHGHTHPKMVDALQKQINMGTSHTAPMEMQYQLAKLLCERVPSMEELRFCNSGTEATMFAIRAARAFTGKRCIIKIEGGYHGSHDYAMVSMDPDLTAEGTPKAHVEDGISETLLEDVFVVHYNDLEAAEKIMKKHHKKIAAMILEPILGYGGGVTASTAYLKGIRKLTKKYGILLIFDEVISIRLSTGGMQKLTGVIPDITALGKTIGGGLPIGAFGGKREIMEQFNPTKDKFIMHSGTFSGNSITMMAGKTALELYDEAAVKRLGELGDRFRNGLRKIMDDLDIKCRVDGIQSISYVQFFEEEPMNKQDVFFYTIPYMELSKYIHMALSINGLFAIVKGILGFFLTTIMTEETIDEILKRFRKTMEMVLPIYEEVKPYPGFAGIIYALLKQLNSNKAFAKNHSQENYSMLLVAKDSPHAIKLTIKDGKIDFQTIKNKKDVIAKTKAECDSAIITSMPSFFGLALGKLKPLKAILTGKLKLKGIKYVQKFTKYFSLLKGI